MRARLKHTRRVGDQTNPNPHILAAAVELKLLGDLQHTSHQSGLTKDCNVCSPDSETTETSAAAQAENRNNIVTYQPVELRVTKSF